MKDLQQLVRENIWKLKPYSSARNEYSGHVARVFLDANENPFNVPYNRYPDPLQEELKAKLSKIKGVRKENIFLGNGSDEVLTVAARAFVDDDEAIGSCDPSYSLYKTLAAIRNVPFVPSPLGPGFSWRAPVVRGAARDVALFLLTNPNAPTSIRYGRDVVADFAKGFPGVVIVDEAYADFADADCTSLATAPDNRNVVVMRTLSKSFSLAGLRLGYCIGPEDLIEAMYKVKDSYNVDAVAQDVACAALSDLDWMRANVAKVVKTRAETAAELRRRGWDVPESQSNFLFAKPAHRPAAEIFEALRARGIFVRYFPGPETGDRLRITIGTDTDMKTLLTALEELDK